MRRQGSGIWRMSGAMAVTIGDGDGPVKIVPLTCPGIAAGGTGPFLTAFAHKGFPCFRNLIRDRNHGRASARGTRRRNLTGAGQASPG